MVSLGKCLKSLRNERGLTQKTMSELLNITDRTYCKYEANDIDPPTSTSIWLADYFDVSLDYLTGRSDQP